MKPTPHIARVYILLALLLLALPSVMGLYRGHDGRLLVAAPRLHREVNDPFAESVVFLAEHSLSGAFGLVLGRPLDTAEADKIFQGRQGALPVYYGGPVGYPDHVYLMVVDEAAGTVSVTPNPPLPLDAPPDGAALYVGYAGWGMIQLNVEFAKGAWDTIPFTPDILHGSGSIWYRARERVGQGAPANDGAML